MNDIATRHVESYFIHVCNTYLPNLQGKTSLLNEHICMIKGSVRSKTVQTSQTLHYTGIPYCDTYSIYSKMFRVNLAEPTIVDEKRNNKLTSTSYLKWRQNLKLTACASLVLFDSLCSFFFDLNLEETFSKQSSDDNDQEPLYSPIIFPRFTRSQVPKINVSSEGGPQKMVITSTWRFAFHSTNYVAIGLQRVTQANEYVSSKDRTRTWVN